MRHADFRRRPGEVALFQDFVEQAEALSVPPQKLDPVGAPASEAEDGARPGRLSDHAC